MQGEFLSLLRTGDVRALFARYSDILLAILVAVIVGMMIVPLPTFVLDLFVTLNIAAAVSLLLIAIYVSEALRIATFPSLLLITTLFRLAIEVSATRLILLKANAGQVIHAFGNFVVAGNLVVGAVVFFILTLIQFIVISKGSERVAEVGARFTLDAMPGKQMSIDAELRAGHIEPGEARRRRALLTRESQFFGSMDGAMKFVKGDAIAGIVVLLTNIVGGLVIGIVQKGMDPATAAKTYTLLTIGAGLVSQIPALVISTAAGIVVTRVSSEEDGGHLGQDIGRQILAQPKALAVAAVLLGLLAIVPGLPTAPFAVLGGLLGLVAYRIIQLDRLAARRTSVTGIATAAAELRGDGLEIPAPLLLPIAIDLSSVLSQSLLPPGGPGSNANAISCRPPASVSSPRPAFPCRRFACVPTLREFRPAPMCCACRKCRWPRAKSCRVAASRSTQSITCAGWASLPCPRRILRAARPRGFRPASLLPLACGACPPWRPKR